MNIRLNRLISLMLILCLLLPSALAETAGDGIIADLESLEQSMRTLLVLGDQLYALDYNGHFYRQVEGGWVASGAYDHPDSLYQAVEADGKVWFLIRQEGLGDAESRFLLAEGSADEGGVITVSDASVVIDLHIDDEDYFYVNDFAVQGGAAYLLSEAPGDWTNKNLYQIDVATGDCKVLAKAPLQEIANYKDGQLLAVRFNWEEQDDDGRLLMPQAVSVDTSSGELTHLGVMNNYNDGALTYDPETDNIYFADDTHVFRLTEAEPEIVGYMLPSSNTSRQGATAVIHHGRFYLEDYRAVISASVDPSQIPAHILRISNQTWYVEDQIRDYAKAHPDIGIEYVDEYWGDLNEFTRVMQGDGAPDIFVESMSNDFVTLREKKYLIDLSSSQILMDTVGRMYPHLTQDLLTDGKLFGLPICLEEYEASGYYQGAFEKAGVPIELVPTTFDELFDFIVTWHDEYYPDNEGMELFEYSYDARYSLFYLIFEAQVNASARSGEPLTFNTPTIRRLLNRLDELQPILDVVAPKMEDDLDDYEYITDNALFTLDQCMPMPRSYRRSDSESFPMILALDEDTPASIKPYMQVMSVNPYSQNAEAAIDLMEYIAQNFGVTFLTAIMPDMNDPIENPEYDRSVARWQEIVAEREKLLADAPEEQIRELQENLDYAKERLNDIETSGRVGMTAEEIQWYRENIAPALVIPTTQYVSSGSVDQMYTVRQRYVDGQMTADEFIQEIDRIVWMVQMENQ